jgi:hypothetical protein
MGIDVFAGGSSPDRWLLFQEDEDVMPAIRERTALELFSKAEQAVLEETAEDSDNPDVESLLEEARTELKNQIHLGISQMLDNLGEGKDSLFACLCWFKRVPWDIRPGGWGYVCGNDLPDQFDSFMDFIQEKEGYLSPKDDNIIINERRYYLVEESDKRDIVLMLFFGKEQGEDACWEISYFAYYKPERMMCTWTITTIDMDSVEAIVADLKELVQTAVAELASPADLKKAG